MLSSRLRFLLLACLLVAALLMSSNFSSPPPSPDRAVQNLRAFARLYGYVRFFHPSDEASLLDWERFAVYGAAKAKAAKNEEELQRILKELFLPVAPTAHIYRQGEQLPPTFSPTSTEGLKLVSWQHRGVGLGGEQQIYMSIRLNRENQAPGAPLGTVTQSVDAVPYRGKEIKLTGYVRTEVQGSGNQGQLWLRVDRAENKRGFFSNMQDRPITATAWQSYEIVGKVDEDAEKIVFGGFLTGKGKIWLDDVRLQVKNQVGEWEQVNIRNPGFEEGVAGKIPNAWSAASPGYEFKLVATDTYQGKQCLQIGNSTFSSKLFNREVQPGDLIRKPLGGSLHCQIPQALYSDEQHTLGPVLPGYSFEKLKEGIAQVNFDKVDGNTDLYLGNVVIAWNVFRHFYPYFDVIKTDWDHVLSATLADALDDRKTSDCLNTLQKMIAQLHDGHGNVYHAVLSNRRVVPVVLDLVEKQVVVLASETEELKRGDIIKSIDGTEVNGLLRKLEASFSGSPQWKRHKALQALTAGPAGTSATVEISRAKEKIRKVVERNSTKRITEFNYSPLEQIKEGVYYVDVSKVDITEFNRKVSELAEAKGVVFDLRGYPNGNHEIICHLIDKPVQSARWNKPLILYPDGEKLAGYDTTGRWLLQSRAPRLKGKIVFLTDGRAISYAESFMGIIEHYKLAEIVGQPTAGANGNVNPFGLPGGFRIAWTGMKVLKHDGTQHHLVGIKPSVPVERTLAGVLEGRDEVLDKAVALIDTK